MHYFCFIFFMFCTGNLFAIIDLDQFEQPFVLETKRIYVPGYPDAFNPAIIQWNNRLLMSFRARDPLTKIANLVGFTWLDKNFNPVGKPQILKLLNNDLKNCYIQDPRLIQVNNRLYMPYSDLVYDAETQTKNRQMCIAEIKYDGVRFIASNEDHFHDFPRDHNNKWEKNWPPFDYQGVLLFAYTISPHKIFLPLIGEKKCVTIAENHEFSSWSWGVLRGGTPALVVDNHYLAFFHSTDLFTTVQSNNQSMQHYFMGAYLFEKEPPFTIEKISPHPIVAKDFYNGVNYKTWKPLQVIFPCGFIFDKNYIWVSYGRQDHEAWIVKLDKKELFKSLIPFNSNF